jgi:hypothetical protein
MGMGIATDHDEFGHGGGTVGAAVAWDLVQTFLAVEFGQAPLHLRRLGKVTALERTTLNG